MMVGCCRTGRSNHIKCFKFGTIELSKEPGYNVNIKQHGDKYTKIQIDNLKRELETRLVMY